MSRIISMDVALNQVSSFPNVVQNASVIFPLPDGVVTEGLVIGLSTGDGPTGFTLLNPARVVATGDTIFVRNESGATGESVITSMVVTENTGPHSKIVSILVDPPLTMTGGVSDFWQFYTTRDGMSSSIYPVAQVKNVHSATEVDVLMMGTTLFNMNVEARFLNSSGSTGGFTISEFTSTGSAGSINQRYTLLIPTGEGASMATGSSFIWQYYDIPSNQSIFVNRIKNEGSPSTIRMQPPQ